MRWLLLRFQPVGLVHFYVGECFDVSNRSHKMTIFKAQKNEISHHHLIDFITMLQNNVMILFMFKNYKTTGIRVIPRY